MGDAKARRRKTDGMGSGRICRGREIFGARYGDEVDNQRTSEKRCDLKVFLQSSKNYTGRLQTSVRATEICQGAREIRGEIRGSKAKAQDMKSEQERVKNHKSHLKDIIEQTWRSTNDAKTAEQEKKRKISDLKISIQQLKLHLSQGSGWTKEQQIQMNKLQATEGDLQEKLEEQTQLLTEIRDSIGSLGQNLSDEEESRQTLQKDVFELDSLSTSLTGEVKQERASKLKLDSRLTEIKSTVEAVAVDIDASRRQIRAGNTELKQKDSRLAKTKRMLESFLKHYEAIMIDTSSLTRSLMSKSPSKKVTESHKVIWRTSTPR